MAKLSYDQLKALWISNGGNPSFAGFAAAVAIAESGGVTDRISPQNRNGTHDQGLWQISRTTIDPTLTDPNTNAKIAISMSNNGVNWKPWCTAWSDNACGTKGGKYLGIGSSALAHMSGSDGKTIPGQGSVFSVDPHNPNQIVGQGGNITDKAQPSDPGYDDNVCIISLPSVAGVGGGCLLKKSQARAIGGVALMASGVVIALVGIALLSGRSVPLPSPRSYLANRPDADDRRAEEVEQRESSKPPRVSGGGKTVMGRGVALEEL